MTAEMSVFHYTVEIQHFITKLEYSVSLQSWNSHADWAKACGKIESFDWSSVMFDNINLSWTG